MRKMQAENKEIDMTVLFNTERAERLRKRLHKKAFKTYKNYEFLKAGLVKPKEQTQRRDALAPFAKESYRFPACDRLASELFTDKIYHSALDHGEALDDRGRRFKGYDHLQLGQVLHGRDGLRQTGFYPDNPAFGFNEGLKQMFPQDRYLQGPKLEGMANYLKDLNDSNKDPQGFFNTGKDAVHEVAEEAR